MAEFIYLVIVLHWNSLTVLYKQSACLGAGFYTAVAMEVIFLYLNAVIWMGEREVGKHCHNLLSLIKHLGN